MPWAKRDVVTSRVQGVNAQHAGCLQALACTSGLLTRGRAVLLLLANALHQAARLA
jgi:hypothetical protein